MKSGAGKDLTRAKSRCFGCSLRVAYKPKTQKEATVRRLIRHPSIKARSKLKAYNHFAQQHGSWGKGQSRV